MTLSDFYARLGGSCDAVLKRIPSEQMLRKFLKMYEKDPSYAQLTEAVKAGDWQSAFRAAHTLKGVAQNLGLDRLHQRASALTEALRGAKPLDDPALLDAVSQAHTETLSALHALD